MCILSLNPCFMCSVHFRAISKVFYIEVRSIISLVYSESRQFKADRHRVKTCLARCAAFIMVSQKFPYTSRLFVLFECPLRAPHPFLNSKNPCVIV